MQAEKAAAKLIDPETIPKTSAIGCNNRLRSWG
jgi:hypothetical protein